MNASTDLLILICFQKARIAEPARHLSIISAPPHPAPKMSSFTSWPHTLKDEGFGSPDISNFAWPSRHPGEPAGQPASSASQLVQPTSQPASQTASQLASQTASQLAGTLASQPATWPASQPSQAHLCTQAHNLYLVAATW